jgi:hypothetical protein
MDPKEVGCEDVLWIHLAQDRVHRWPVFCHRMFRRHYTDRFLGTSREFEVSTFVAATNLEASCCCVAADAVVGANLCVRRPSEVKKQGDRRG